MKQLLYTTIAAIYLVITCSCSCKPLLNIENFATKPPVREIEILPIVLGLDPSRGEEFSVLDMVNDIMKDVNIKLTYKKVVYVKQYINIQECNFAEFMYVNSLDLDAMLDYQCKARVVVFFEVENSCLNLRGCAPLGAIRETMSRMWMFLSGNAVDDARVMAHEFGHLLGAHHVSDGSLMCPYVSQTQNWRFSDFSKGEIDEVLRRVYNEPLPYIL